MNTPVPTLMERYGTADVFAMKAADGSSSLLSRLGLGILNYGLASSNHKGDVQHASESALHNEANRELELAKLQQANDGLRHTQAPRFVPAGSDLPAGWDEGMVRLASVAAFTGVDMAKSAGIGDFVTAAKTLGQKALPALKQVGQKVMSGAGSLKPPTVNASPAAGDLIAKGKKFLGGGLGLKTNLALAGGTLAAGALTSKAINAGTRTMSSEAGTPTYGQASHGVGYQMPFGTNQYGQPQYGSPLM